MPRLAVPVISLVVPAYNEEASIGPFLDEIHPVMERTGATYEIVFVNDGSTDGTLGALIAAQIAHPEVRVVSLARNFGKDIALTAGLAHASGEAVIPMDSDLQHPPELIPTMMERWRSGYSMVVGVRKRRDEESWLRRLLARAFYWMIRRMTKTEVPPNAGDFRLIDRRVVDVINAMPERCRFMKGIFAWPGFQTAYVSFEARERPHSKSTWSFWKLWSFALDGIFSFSSLPLQVWTYAGVLSALGAFAYLVITLVEKLAYGIDVPGYASILVALLFFNGVLLISNGIQGEYLARIFEEVKGRPLYVVEGTWGIPETDPRAVSPPALPPAPGPQVSRTGVPENS